MANHGRAGDVGGTQSPGPGVDATGRPVIDPTANVTAVVDAAVKRIDDLRNMSLDHVDKMASLTAHYEEKLRNKESERIDAIRAVDVNAVQRAAEVQATQALTLQTQVATSAEAMRAQVAAAAAAAASALAAALEPIQKSIDDLRRSQYELQGERSLRVDNKSSTQWAFGAAISVVVTLLSIASLVLYVASHH